MSWLHRLRRLPALDRRLLLEAVLLLGLVRAALALLPFATVQDLAARWSAVRRFRHSAQPTAARVALAVQVASRYVPHAACLAHALAAHRLLARYGYGSHIQIGVIKRPGAPLQAHAWVECNGRVVIGDTGQLEQYTILSATRSMAL